MTQRAPLPAKRDTAADIAEARARHLTRPLNPSVSFVQKEAGRWRLEPGYTDMNPADWEVLICEAFGSASYSVMWTFINQLRGLMGSYHDGDDWRPDEMAVNAALAMVADAKPENTIQAALVAQMVAVHFMTMRAAKTHGHSSHVADRDASMVAKLARTYAGQAETLGKLQGNIRPQEITVRYEKRTEHHHHQHVHYHDERSVNLGGGVGQNRGQPQEPMARTVARESRPALSGPDPARDGVSETRDPGPPSLPTARVRARGRRTSGASERKLSNGELDGGSDGAAPARRKDLETLPTKGVA